VNGCDDAYDEYARSGNEQRQAVFQEALDRRSAGRPRERLQSSAERTVRQHAQLLYSMVRHQGLCTQESNDRDE